MDKWHIVYREISAFLYDFYLVNKNTGGSLFEKLINDKEFVSKNKWINKFNDDPKTRSIDPIHIFSSINGNKLSDKNRIERINILLRVFSNSKFSRFYSEIDFYGCPAPVTINLISTRNIIEQQEIWSSFASIYKNKQEGLTSKIFINSSKWYCIDIMSFTQFLFWVDSSNFLPLDKNTIGFLLAIKKIENRPVNLKEYKSLLTNQETNIYRELTAIAYDLMIKGIQGFQYSMELSSYLSNEKIVNFRQSHFKIIGIKPLDDIKSDYLKVLQKNKIYKFYNYYHFKDDDDKVITIKKEVIDLYKIEDFPNVSISAIVGKNGKGKSTITELLYMGIYNLSVKKGLLGKKFEELSGLNFELYYTSDFLYKLRFENDKITVYKYENLDNKFVNSIEIDFSNYHLDSFFYTIAINYSHYGLNSKKVDYDWITPLSHKNDGYQTPIVINPMRTEGNFNINREDELLKSRLLSNVLEPIGENNDYSLREISSNKRAISIVLELQQKKVDFLYDDVKLSVVKASRQKFILKEVYRYFEIIETEIPFKEFIDKYVVKKLVNICLKYKSYHHFFDKINFSFKKEGVGKFLKMIDNDKSHITFKLKQALNYLKYNHYSEFINGETNEINIEIDKLSNKIESVKSINSNANLKTILLIPPTIFSSQIIFNDGSNADKISSGENQLINIVSSIVYHLNNLDSVMIDRNLYNYGYINIMLDEVELYFHPDFQRKFIKYLLNYISKINLDRIEGINLCLITHSPFILSDIIDENILFLGDTVDDERRTFGANIYDLLADGFFLNDGFIGEFAENRIQEIIDYLNDKKIDRPVWFKNEKEVKLLIEKIGEPFLKKKLLEMFYNKFPNEFSLEEKNKEKAKLLKRLKELEG